MNCILVKSKVLEDWFSIERETHDGKEFWRDVPSVDGIPGGREFIRSCRPSDADIEGTYKEMYAIVQAIFDGKSISFDRCECKRVDDYYLISSPRNSTTPAKLTNLEALYLAICMQSTLAENRRGIQL